MRVFRNPGHTISSFLAPIPQKPNNTDWRRNGIENEACFLSPTLHEHHFML